LTNNNGNLSQNDIPADVNHTLDEENLIEVNDSLQELAENNDNNDS
jgi:hypothetical protein